MERPPQGGLFLLRRMKFESPFAAALNHLLDAEPWARERLLPFASETLELRAPPLPALRFAVTADGRQPPSPAPAARRRSRQSAMPAAAARAAPGTEAA